PVPVAGALVLAAARPRRGRFATCIWLSLVALLAAAGGLVVGTERLGAIDAGALEARDGSRAAARGIVTAVPRRSDGTVSVRIETAAGRVLVEAPEPVEELPVGREVRATGTLREPAPWQSAYLERHGIGEILKAERIELTGRRRGGVSALADGVRDRAEEALERGMDDREAALARGFVLGQDDRIDAATVDDFKRSGLAHLLAVSGQNVILLALLAMPLLAALNLSLRTRLLCVLALIALYVPVTGAGPSIQRAGVMGAAGIVAALAGRPRSRWYAVVLAALVTLAANPRASGDIGWQLSFAAVIGILLWTEGISGWLLRRLGERRTAGPVSWRRALADGAAMTIAATLATAPLMAHHFESVSITTLAANLLALPAVAPVMWLGMLVAMAGQLPALPVEPLNAVNALLIAYVAQVARWTAAPDWALADIRLSAPAVLITYAVVLCAGSLARMISRRRRGLAPRAPIPALAVLLAIGGIGAIGWRGGEPVARSSAGAPGLEITVLDVGQGDAILLEPADGDPVLVDTGPPGSEIVERLADEGVERLAALAITHDQLDHAGGAGEILGSVRVASLVYADAGRDLPGIARAAGAETARLAEGARLASGRLRLDVLWPPRGLLTGPAADPNALSLVLLARWRGFSMLLTGDAEAEGSPVTPGPVDVVKVAHHGSEDAGLERLLEVTVPRAAVISVGEENPYGHPAPETLAALAVHDVPVLRTDRDGDVELEVEHGRWTAGPDE
ncbi:MAG: ComEC/Rec2 family competence protein, partial [Solirubrobacterales bacterium]